MVLQTKNEFRVLKPSPDKADVPVNTGIEMVFSHDNTRI